MYHCTNVCCYSSRINNEIAITQSIYIGFDFSSSVLLAII